MRIVDAYARFGAFNDERVIADFCEEYGLHSVECDALRAGIWSPELTAVEIVDAQTIEHGSGYGSGDGSGSGYGYGYGDGSGDGYGSGSGDGSGSGAGYG